MCHQITICLRRDLTDARDQEAGESVPKPGEGNANTLCNSVYHIHYNAATGLNDVGGVNIGVLSAHSQLLSPVHAHSTCAPGETCHTTYYHSKQLFIHVYIDCVYWTTCVVDSR